MLIERPKTTNKNVIDCNMPFQLVNRSSLKEDTKRRSMAKGEQPPQYLQDETSRSNSIQGRKLSFCDAQLTVSQHTIEPFERIAITQRNREDNNQSQLYANGGSSQHQYSSFLINQSQSESILNSNLNQQQQYAHPIGSRGKNPRQSKEPSKKKKRLQQNTSGISNSGNGLPHNSNKLQKAIKQQFKLYQQNSKVNSSAQSGVPLQQNQQTRSPLQEKKQQYQQNSYSLNAYEGMKPQQKNQLNRNTQQPASFMLTFSKDKSNSPNYKAGMQRQEKENNKVCVNMEKEGIINIIEQKQRQNQQASSPNDRNSYKNNPSANQRTLSSGKKWKRQHKSQQSSKEKRYSSPSPNSNGNRSSLNKLQQNNSYYKNNNRQSVENMKIRSYIGSGEKDRSPMSQNLQKSIDKLVRNNIKKQKELENKQQEVAAQQIEQLSQRKFNIVVKNKEIRNRNLQKNQNKVKKLQISHIQDEKPDQQARDKYRNELKDRIIEMKSKSPLKAWQDMQKEKNKDMPLKIQQKRNKKLLGLEIFDLKKELGMDLKVSQQKFGDQSSIDQTNNQSTTYRKLINKKEQKNNNILQDLSSVMKINETDHINQLSTKNKKHQQQSVQQKLSHDEKEQVMHQDLQKLILKQNKKRSKIEKQEKFQEYIKHQKVIQNLKSLNKIIGQQRKKMVGVNQAPARNENESRIKHFKTVQDQQMIQQIKNFDHHINQDRSASRADQGLHDRERDLGGESKHNVANTISARRSTLGPVTKLNVKDNGSSSRVVYSFVSQGKPVVFKKKQQSHSKQKKSFKKDQLIQMLLEQLKSHQSLSHQQSVDNNYQGQQSKRSLQKKRQSLRGKSRSKSKTNKNRYNKSVINHQHQQQLQSLSIDSPELRIRKKRKSKQENRPLKRQFDNDFSNLGSSRSMQNSPTRSTKEIGRGSSLRIPPPKQTKQNITAPQQNDEHSEEDVEIQNIDDQIILNDEMMIFCVLNTAASIIQKSFRSYMLKKKQHLQQIQQQLYQKQQQAKAQKSARVKEEQKEVLQFQDSANLEDRLVPSKESKESERLGQHAQQQQDQLQRKTPKHTFSFGNYDEQNQAVQQPHANFQSFYQDNNALVSANNTGHSQSTNNRRETSPVDDKTPLGRGTNQFQYQDISNNGGDFFKLNQMQEQQPKDPKQRTKEEDKKQQQEESEDKVEEEELKKVLNIDNKLKRAMQSLVSKQKTTTFIEQLKRKQNKHPKQQIEEIKSKEQIQKQKSHDEGIINVNEAKAKIQKEAKNQEQINKNNNEKQLSPINTHNDSFNLLQKHLNQNESFQIDLQEEKEIDISRISIEIEEPVTNTNQQDYHNQLERYLQDDEDFKKDENNISILNEENINHMNNKSGSDLSSSMMASFGEGTDKIICESPINTNEEILEAAVNESNTLNNEESGINESNLLQQSRVEDSQLNINVFQSEKGLQGNGEHNNSSLMIDADGTEGYNFDNGMRHESKFGAAKSDKGDTHNIGLQGIGKSNQQLKQKPMLRLMFGDEQYLKLQEEQDVISYDRELGSNQDFFGSGPSSNRMLQSENPYFLATNASIFERNPFKEFTSNKLSEILQGKNAKELLEMKEDAIKYQEKLEKGFINRLERKQELSPLSSQRRKYELECWVTNERKTLQQSQKEKLLLSQPLNVFDLEKERKEAARIIEQVNKKVNDIKGKVGGKQKDDFKMLMAMRKKQFDLLDTDIVNKNDEINISKNTNYNSQQQKDNKALTQFNLDDDKQFKSQQQQYKKQVIVEYVNDKSENKLPELQDSNKLEQIQLDDKSLSQLSFIDLSQEIYDDKKKQKEVISSSLMPNLKTQKQEFDIIDDDIPTELIEISFDDDEEESKIPEVQIQKQNFLEDQSSLKYELEQRQQVIKQQDLASREEKERYADQITSQIFELLMKDELKAKSIFPIREQSNISTFSFALQPESNIESKPQSFSNVLLKELQAVQISDDFYSDENLSQHGKRIHQEEAKQAYSSSKDKEINEVFIQKPKQTLEVTIQESQREQIKPIKVQGIDTSEEATLKYIEDIFDQIMSRKELFMQAFATPIYKNPLEVLSNLQRPSYGDFEMTADFSNSLSCILNVQLYLTLEKARDNLIHQTIQQIKQQNLERSLGTQNGSIPTEDELTDLISESQHIHNKIIFDCVNEALNSVRPYSIAGEPMPWSTKAKKNLIFLLDDPENINKILKNVKVKVMQWSMTKAGALPPRYPDYQYNNQQMEAIMQMDEEMFSQQREKCLAQMLARDLVEGEEKWLDYEMEEAQVKIDLSDIVLEQLVGEVCTILQEIKSKRQPDTSL